MLHPVCSARMFITGSCHEHPDSVLTRHPCRLRIVVSKYFTADPSNEKSGPCEIHFTPVSHSHFIASPFTLKRG
jgi:hypothetical protein